MLDARGRRDIEVRSGGIAPYARDSSLVSLDARFVLRDEGIELSPDTMSCDLKRHREHFDWADLIVAMTDEQKRMLSVFPEAADVRTVTLRELAGDAGDIEDPAGRGADFYGACRDQIRDCLGRALDRLLAAPEGAGGR
jgi:protein-tyrosine-phosphatase